MYALMMRLKHLEYIDFHSFSNGVVVLMGLYFYSDGCSVSKSMHLAITQDNNDV